MRLLRFQASTWWKSDYERPAYASRWTNCIQYIQAPSRKWEVCLLTLWHSDFAWPGVVTVRELWSENTYIPLKMMRKSNSISFFFFLRAMCAMERCLAAGLVRRDFQFYNIVSRQLNVDNPHLYFLYLLVLHYCFCLMGKTFREQLTSKLNITETIYSRSWQTSNL